MLMFNVKYKSTEHKFMFGEFYTVLTNQLIYFRKKNGPVVLLFNLNVMLFNIKHTLIYTLNVL